MYRINDELKEFLESGVGTLIGTADGGGRPHVSYVWGLKIADDGQGGRVYLERARADQALSDMNANPMVAVTAASPVLYRSVQLKGRYTGHGEPDDDELAAVEKQRNAFLVETMLVGDPPNAVRNLWMDDVIRIEFTVERAFDQTPGPNAGKAL